MSKNEIDREFRIGIAIIVGIALFVTALIVGAVYAIALSIR